MSDKLWLSSLKCQMWKFFLSLFLNFDKLLLHRKNYMETSNSRLLQLQVRGETRPTDVKTKNFAKNWRREGDSSFYLRSWKEIKILPLKKFGFYFDQPPPHTFSGLYSLSLIVCVWEREGERLWLRIIYKETKKTLFNSPLSIKIHNCCSLNYKWTIFWYFFDYLKC
jgi:hypothetical protein